MVLNSKQAKIYREIWASPYSKKLKFSDVSKLLVSLGYRKKSAGGANIVFKLDGKTWGMHPPHPNPHMKRPYVKQLRDFLIETQNDKLLEE
ncbi:MAG: type II toxin-antitoxin system HicA family toxin [Phormidesmis sp.]